MKNLADTQQELFKYISLFFLLVAITITSYFIARILAGIDEPFPVGEALVRIEWPSPETSMFHAKPVTYLVFSIMLAWLFGLEALRDKFLKISDLWMKIMMIIACLLAFAGGYETFWNFSMWSAMYSAEPTKNPDTFANTYPNPRYPWNFVFATKMFSLLFFAAIYFIIFLMTVSWRRERKS